MNLTLAMMDDDFNLIDRWGQMHHTEPAGQFKSGPGPELVGYINAAVVLRLAAMQRHMTLAELRTLRTMPEPAIAQLAQEARALLAAQTDLAGPEAVAVVAQWERLMLNLCAGQPALLVKLLAAYSVEPLLQGTTVFDHTTLAVIKRALLAQGHPLAPPWPPLGPSVTNPLPEIFSKNIT
jgi:hypothetical protein